MMNLTAADVAVLAGANGLFTWLLKLSIEKRLDLTLQSRLESVKADLSVRVAFSKLIAEKRFEALLDLWASTREVSTVVRQKPEDEALQAVFKHIDVTGAVDILLPQATIDAVTRYRQRMVNLATALHRGGPETATGHGGEPHAAITDGEAADVELRAHLRQVMEADRSAEVPVTERRPWWRWVRRRQSPDAR